MNVLDLFSGCGGISSGFKLAGFNISGGIDIDPDSIKTFQKNFSKSKAICEDLLEYSDERILNDFSNENIDVIVGGPPCQGFSSANRWNKETDDPRNKLFFEYLRFVELLKPKAVVIENVRGILTRDKGFAKNRIENLLNDLGYNVDCKVLNASDHGVPQNRLRAFFVAIRKDYNETFDFNRLSTKPKVTVKEAIGELYDLDKKPIEKISDKPQNEYVKYLRKKEQEIYNHEIKYPAQLTQERISHVPQGGNWKDIPTELFPNNRNNRHSSAFKRLDENACSVTIDTGNAHSNYFHPLYNRIPTVREAARIQSFKDSFIFEGSRTSQYRQVGNAVPPLLAKAVAEELKNYLNKK
ncbi:DNA cytosine methyltransferase [Aequorivita sinensis]|uniref:DNA cytosine methyltransferase n=1 Tax=Aequorivita sinensis TaxID=1382458 RepID=UPI002300A75D|nr:DNA cytosine methyltransferase [Aequorivita sinensis]